MIKLLKQADNLIDNGKSEDALKILRKIDNSKNYGAKIAELYGAAFTILGDAPKAAAAYFDAAKKDEFLRAQRGHIANYIFLLHYLQNINTYDLYNEMANFESLFGDIKPFPANKYNHKKIKIGYLLANPQKSSLSNFIRPFFTNYDKNNFEVYVYAFGEKFDDFTAEIKQYVDLFKILDFSSYYDTAKIIKDDETDILLDFTGYGLGGDTLSVLAYRPAPLQIIGIGWPGITELSFVDYVLSDIFLTDEIMRDKALIIPNALCFSPDESQFHDSTCARKNYQNLSLGVFNNFMKITDEALLLWMDILKSLPNATLTLQDCTIYEERIKFMQNRLNKLGFQEFNEKITIKTASENYFLDILNTNIILDTFPYTGGFMTATAITLGRPVITLAGNRFSSKFSADILRTANLEEFIAYNKNEYKKYVISIARDIKNQEYYKKVKKRVFESELLNKASYMQNFETTLKRIVY